MRTAEAVHRYNRDAVIAKATKLNDYYSLFGGEPMVLAFDQFEELLKIAFDKWGHSGLQTNGTLITDKHIELFDKYKTHVGISLDGPPELNDSRWAGTEDATQKTSERTIWAITRLCELAKEKEKAHLLPSLIITLHSGNCSKENFPIFVKWLHELDDLGIKHINLHVMEMDACAQKWYLDPDELADRLIDLWNEMDTFKNIRFSKFQEILKLLQGNDEVMCVWHACDPWNTSAVQGIENDGSPSHCSRTNKDGKNWLPAEGQGSSAKHAGVFDFGGKRHHERQLALYVSPQEDGGCKDCPYWLMCLGQCPGTGEDGDWRRRTSYCSTYKKLFAEGVKRLRAVGIKPLPDWEIRKDLEKEMYDLWANDQSPQLGHIIRDYKDFISKGMVRVPNGWHGDHEDVNRVKNNGK